MHTPEASLKVPDFNISEYTEYTAVHVILSFYCLVLAHYTSLYIWLASQGRTEGQEIDRTEERRKHGKIRDF